MIVNEQYCFDIILGVEGSLRGQRKDFLTENDLCSLNFKLSTGLAVPIFDITILLHDIELSSCFRQGSLVTIKFGPNTKELVTYKCELGRVKFEQGLDSSTDIIVTFEAVLEKSAAYLANTDVLAKQGTSLNVMRDLSKSFFGTELVTDILDGSVKETPMVWRQDSLYNNIFLATVWLHMNIYPDVPVAYIDDKLRLHIRSLEGIKKQESSAIFVPRQPKSGTKEVSFFNLFNPQSYKTVMNIVNSHQMVCVRNVETSIVDIDFPDPVDPILAATKEIESSGFGNVIKYNRLEGSNVFKGYKKAYQYNRSKLNTLSSIVATVATYGFFKGVNLCDTVEVSGVSEANSGRYIVSDITYHVGHGQPIFTSIMLMRDNVNRLERYILKLEKKNAFTDFMSEINKFYAMVRNLKVLVQKCRYLVDGSLFRDLQKFVHSMKYDLLRSFSVCGIPLDFNSTKDLFNSVQCIGMGILNKIVTTYLPKPYNTLLLNYPGGVQTREVVNKLLMYYVKDDFRFLITELQGLVFDITDGLGRVAKNASVAQKALTAKNTVNNDNVSFTDTSNGVVEVNVVEKEVQELDNIETRVNNILQEFLDNTSEVDIPLPLVDLTESQSLYTDEELRNLLANLVVTELSSRGYLDNVDNFKDVLLGNQSLTFAQINTINQNTGLILYPRFWGSYTQPEELTDFYITEQFRDMYKTPDFTTLVSAKKGQHIFVAFPTFERNLKIFINSTLQDMEVIPEMDLHITDKSGNIIRYNVYVSPNGYNSNSNMLEVRK